MSASYLIGDVFDQMATLEDGSVDLVLTSPPFLALRSYLPADHPDKTKEIGSEPTPAAFIDTLLRLTAEWDRLLAPYGSICIELGDTYSGSGGGGGDYLDGGRREGQQQFAGSAASMRESNAAYWRQKNEQPDAWPLAKSLTLVPELYRVGLVYGINPLTGQKSPAGRWRVRNVVRWHRPNPSPGALGDKYRCATTDLVVACKSDRRWFDLDAVRTEAQVQMGRRVPGNNEKGSDAGSFRFAERVDSHLAGAPPLDTWVIPTHPFKGAHYATWPPALCVVPVESMCPRQVCRTCGKPRRRITEDTPELAAAKETFKWESGGLERGPRRDAATRVDVSGARVTPGWSDCGHDDFRPGVVLDPFAGSGTTLAVATGHGRDAIGIDLDERNADLAHQRVGMFLKVVNRERVVS